MDAPISINSGHVANAIDGQLIQLVKVLQVEHSCEFDDALTTGREYLNKKVVELMTDDDNKNISEIAEVYRKKYKENPNNELAKAGYILCKYFGLYKYLLKG